MEFVDDDDVVGGGWLSRWCFGFGFWFGLYGFF